MSTLIKQLLAAGAVAVAASALCAAPAVAAPAKKEAAKAAKPAKAKAARAHPKATAVLAAAEPNEPEPDITDTTTTEFNCELGNKVTIYQNEKDDSNIALRWKKRLHRLTRIGTTTGAKRFENTAFGLIWIGIPSKGMLLDSRLNRQLANECQTLEQANPTPVVPAAVPPADKMIAPGAEPVPAAPAVPAASGVPAASAAPAVPASPAAAAAPAAPAMVPAAMAAPAASPAPATSAAPVSSPAVAQ